MAKRKTASSSRRRSGSRSKKSTSKAKSRSRKPRRTTSRARKGTSSRNPLRFGFGRRLDIFAVVMLLVGLFSLLSVLSPEQGLITRAWLDILKQGFGWSVYVVPFALIGGGLWWLRRTMGDRSAGLNYERIFGILLLFLAVLITFHGFLGGENLDERLEYARQGEGGGVIGAALLNLLMTSFGGSGTVIALLAIFVIGIVFTIGLSVPELVDYAAEGSRKLYSRLSPYIRMPTLRVPRSTVPKEKTTAADRPPKPQLKPAEAAQVSPTTEPPVVDLPPVETAAPTHWATPQLEDILEPGIEGRADAAFDQERATIIEETLAAFGAPGRVVEINRGPTITQFGVEPAYVEGRGGRRTKVKVSKISSLADDLTLALAAPSIRIEAPVPGKGFVGVEVPNAEISLVSLRDVMEAKSFTRIKSKLRLGLGQDVSGNAIAADLAAMPHLLVAGTTGSGKSVCINSIITSLLLQNTPDDLKFVMIDPKRVELTYFNGIPHLLSPVIVELERVVGSLKWISREMDERYRRFAKQGVRNITEYNQMMESIHQVGLPYLVVVIDELADLMMLAPDETERVITRMAQLARATGIHLVIATQRPSVDVVTGIIKANFPARIAFAVASSVDSRVILDQPGAERLLGRGDMLFQAPDASAPVRMQGSFVSDAELARLIRFWKNAALSGESTQPAQAMPSDSFSTSVPLKQVPMWEQVAEEEGPKDELFDEAVEIVRRMRRASISLLQRRMRIGYTRAARLIDQMEEQGIIGPATGGSQPREVLDFGDIAVMEEEE